MTFTPIGGSIQSDFEDFHRLNPWVLERMIGMTRDLARRGRRKVGIGMLFEVLRWQYAMSTTDTHSEFKLNNNYRSRYARLIMELCPDLDGIYETRELKAS